jgi:hypothetical protein
MTTAAPDKSDRRTLIWMWVILFAAVAVLRTTNPPIRGLDRRISLDESISVAILLGAGPLAIVGLGVTALYVLVRGKRSWWTYHATLAIMGAAIAFSAAYADWNTGGVSAASIWVTLSYAHEFLFTPFWAFAASFLVMAVAPPVASAIRRMRGA